MHVIGHQHIRMQCAIRLCQRLIEPAQIADVVALTEKAGRAIVAALHDVQGNPVEMEARAARHRWGRITVGSLFNASNPAAVDKLIA